MTSNSSPNPHRSLYGTKELTDAQYEIRVYANAPYDIVKAVAPIALQAWEEHVYQAKRFSWTEMQVLGYFIGGGRPAGSAADALLVEAKKHLTGRALDEFKSKIFLGDK